MTPPIASLRALALPLRGERGDYDALLRRIGDARFVLLGEASHGTHEFYAERATITKRLVRDCGFNAIAVEADWPDAFRVHRWVTGRKTDPDAPAALGSFERFPRWMWRNADVLSFVDWLHDHNRSLGDSTPKVGFFGLDLYSLHASIAVILAELDRADPAAAARARHRYACFDRYGGDVDYYGHATGLGVSEPCTAAVLAQLREMQERAMALAHRDGAPLEDDLFALEQNARLVANAEEYYRLVVRGSGKSWNLRDRHMADTIDELATFLARRLPRPKIVVWEHNSHLGDARATSMGRGERWNVGQLVRERHDGDSVLVGFTTYDGTVTAASDWDGPAERKRVRPALLESYEAMFHDIGFPRFFLRTSDPETSDALGARLERAIGVIYRPETERQSHYFRAALGKQFDVVLHFDRTHAVEPFEALGEESADLPETYPFAL